jgi:hypothetical protein
VNALGDAEVEADSAGFVFAELHTEVLVEGAVPDGVEVYFEGAEHLLLQPDGLDNEVLLAEVVLVHHEVCVMVDFPLSLCSFT